MACHLSETSEATSAWEELARLILIRDLAESSRTRWLRTKAKRRRPLRRKHVAKAYHGQCFLMVDCSWWS
ncbi:hypothetical protein V5799_025694 [Amblyomma americanum]|uniref:Uncharacterized protein n=1 Tax=Amblyomma americanum TaxID=6943 RepID=A0AAQ4E8Q6_AMBAM